jgi:oligopeptide transport system substrate-binding protein
MLELLWNKEKSHMSTSKPFANRFLPVLPCLLILAACSLGSSPSSNTPSSSTKASADKQILISPLAGIADISTFDPGLSTDLPSLGAIDMLFTGLVQLNDKLEVVPQLAQSYHVDPHDGLTWTFTLKPGLRFSDGAALTSQDVIFSIDRALQPGLKSTTAPIYLALVKDALQLNAGKLKTLIGDSLLAPDSQTVVIIANKKASYFLDSLSYSCSYVVEKRLLDKYGSSFTAHLTEGGGAGPWKLLSYTPGKDIQFVPNPNYYGPKPQLKKVVMPFYKVADTAYRAYLIGQVSDASVPSSQLASAKSLPNQQYKQVPLLWTSYLAMNYLVKPFDNIKIRQAFAVAINKDALVQSVFKGTYIPSNHVVPQGMPGYNPSLKGPAGVPGTMGAPDQARQLLQQGLQEEGLTLQTLPPITLTVATEGSADFRNKFAVVQQMWQNALGINVKIEDVDLNKLITDIEAAANNAKGLMFWSYSWIADYPDPQDWLTLQFDAGVPNNSVNYGQNFSSDALVQQATQALLRQADVNPNQQERLQQYMKAEQQLVDDVAWLPLYQFAASFVRKPCVQGLVNNPEGLTPPDDWANVFISAQTPCADTAAYQ